MNRSLGISELDHTVDAVTVLHSTSDTREGIAAFLEKRRPRFATPTF